MTKIDKMNRALLEALKNRGHTDEQIHGMSADEMFDEYCEWNGLINYGPSLRYFLDHARELEAARALTTEGE